MNNSHYGVDIRTIDSLAMADLLSQILAGNMRKEDREELEAQGRMPYDGLYESMTTSIEAYYAITFPKTTPKPSAPLKRWEPPLGKK